MNAKHFSLSIYIFRMSNDSTFLHIHFICEANCVNLQHSLAIAMIINRMSAVKWPLRYRVLWGPRTMVFTLILVSILPIVYLIGFYPSFSAVYYSRDFAGFTYQVCLASQPLNCKLHYTDKRIYICDRIESNPHV